MNAKEADSGSKLLLVEALDWRSQRTWAVFLCMVLGYGAAASILVTAVKLFVLRAFGHLDVERLENLGFAVSIAVIVAATILIGLFCRRYITEADLDDAWMQKSGYYRYPIILSEWLLGLLWLGLTGAWAFSLHNAFFASFDFGPKAQISLMFLLSFTIAIGTLPVAVFLLRWGQRKPRRDC